MCAGKTNSCASFVEFSRFIYLTRRDPNFTIIKQKIMWLHKRVFYNDLDVNEVLRPHFSKRHTHTHKHLFFLYKWCTNLLKQFNKVLLYANLKEEFVLHTFPVSHITFSDEAEGQKAERVVTWRSSKQHREANKSSFKLITGCLFGC